MGERGQEGRLRDGAGVRKAGVGGGGAYSEGELGVRERKGEGLG